jgi:hypothetical protein
MSDMKTLTKISVMGLALWFVLVAWQQYHRSADLFFFGKGQSFLVVVDPLTPIIMQVSLETHSRYVYTGWDKTPSWFLEHISAVGISVDIAPISMDPRSITMKYGYHLPTSHSSGPLSVLFSRSAGSALGGSRDTRKFRGGKCLL